MYDLIKTFGSLLLLLFLTFFCVNYFSNPDSSLEQFSQNPKEVILSEFPKFKKFWVSQDLSQAAPLVEKFGLRWDLQPVILAIKEYVNNFLAESSWREYLSEKESVLLAE
jgi:hypothetical protein